MGDSLRVSHSSKSSEPRVITTTKVRKGCLVASVPKGFSKKSLQCIASMKQGILGNGAAGDIGVFLLTTAALEIVRRLSKAKCPFVWHGLQALQLLCYPPLRWIQRWTPFKGLVKNMEALSRPMLALSIATVFSDQSSSNNSYDSQANSESQSQLPSNLSDLDIRSSNEAPKILASKKWLLDLHKEFDKQGLTLPERLDEDELHRFYAAANGEFSRFISSLKKTIHWRQTYSILSQEELEAWSRFVFWHSYDVKLRPCLIIRLGLACSNLNSNNRPLFAKAVVSQIEHGVMNLVDKEHPQITVLMDCKGLSPFGFPMQMMRSCAILLQDHYPRRLGCLAVIRLPAVARVITQTLFQVLKPATRQKLRIIGENYQEVLSEFLQSLPLFLGGMCSCSNCSVLSDVPSGNEEIIQTRPREDIGNDKNEEIIQTCPSVDLKNDANVSSHQFYYHTDTSMSRSTELVIRTIIVVVIFWILISFMQGVHHAGSIPFL